jgi:four helix bundle protein
MQHKAEALKDRTKQFALRIIRVIRSLPAGPESRIIGHQLLRSGMSVAANYRAVCRARSRAGNSSQNCQLSSRRLMSPLSG